jgi:TonB family protein
MAEGDAIQSFEAKSLPVKQVSREPIDYYPFEARRQGLTGRICLAYSVDAKGHVKGIDVLESDGPLLDKQARRLLERYSFEVPPDWAAIEGPKKRYRMGYIFELSNKPKVDRFDESIPTVVINGSGLGG